MTITAIVRDLEKILENGEIPKVYKYDIGHWALDFAMNFDWTNYGSQAKELMAHPVYPKAVEFFKKNYYYYFDMLIKDMAKGNKARGIV